MRRLVTAMLGLGVGLGTVLAAPTAQAAAPPLVAMTGTFSTHDAEMPTTNVAARTLVSATLTQDYHGGNIRATVRLGGAPTTSTQATLVVAFGKLNGTTCEILDRAVELFSTVGTNGGGVSYQGATITVDQRNNFALVDPWDCGSAAIFVDGTQVDAMTGLLKPVYGTPKIDLITPKQVKAAPRDWVNVRVDLANGEDAPMDATDVRLTAKGKGIKVRKLKTKQGRLTSRRTVEFQVRLTAKKRKSRVLTLTARSGSVTSTRRIRIKAVKPAKRPRAGKYRFAKKANGSFRIKGRTIRNFKSRFLITCGGPANPTYTVTQVRFPTTKIPRSGLVDATFRKGSATVSLRMRVRGQKVTAGNIHYGNNAPICYGGQRFNAKRR